MKRSRVLWGLSVAVTATWAATVGTGARSYEHARAVGARCSTCHDTHKPGIENLNARGRWFMRHRTLEGFSPEKAAAQERANARAEPAARTPAGGQQHNPAGTSADLEKGRKVFERVCQACHGARGEGTRMGRPLNQGAFDAEAVGRIAGIIRDGIRGTTMQAYKGRLKEDEIAAVSAYVASLRTPDRVTR